MPNQNPLKSQIAANRERFDKEFQCEKCLSEGKDITHYEELPVIRKFLTTSQTSLLQTAIAAVEEMRIVEHYEPWTDERYEKDATNKIVSKVVELLKVGIDN